MIILTVLPGVVMAQGRTRGEQDLARLLQQLGSTDYVGVGACRVRLDEAEAYDRARGAALVNLAQQVEVRVVAHDRMSELYAQAGTQGDGLGVYRRTLELHNQTVLQGWREVATWRTGETVWAVVSLSRSLHQGALAERHHARARRMRRRMEQAGINGPVDAIRRYLDILDTLEQQTTADEAMLYQECLGRLGALVTTIRLVPGGGRERFMRRNDTLVMQVLYKGAMVQAAPVRWQATDRRVVVVPLDGNHATGSRAVLQSLPPTREPVEIRAQLDLDGCERALRRRGLYPPTGSCSVQRLPLHLYCAGGDDFSRALMHRLEQRNAISLTPLPQTALHLDPQLHLESEAGTRGDLYVATARLTVRLYDAQGVALLSVTKSVVMADGLSPQRAQAHTYVQALDEAVRQVEEAL